MAKQPWNPDFAPSYTPEQMLKAGIFEGKYLNSLRGLPSAWYKLPKVLGPKDDPDPSLNKFKVKSRKSLSYWRDKGWTTRNSPMGWFEWYCHYSLGRRLKDEDPWQIGRWRSFVARHQGGLASGCTLSDLSCRPVQRQALLQWAWDSTTPFDDAQRKKNLTNLKRALNITLE